MLRVTLTPDPIAGWRLEISGELMLAHVAGVYTDLAAVLRALEERRTTFEHAGNLYRAHL